MICCVIVSHNISHYFPKKDGISSATGSSWHYSSVKDIVKRELTIEEIRSRGGPASPGLYLYIFDERMGEDGTENFCCRPGGRSFNSFNSRCKRFSRAVSVIMSSHGPSVVEAFYLTRGLADRMIIPANSLSAV